MIEKIYDTIIIGSGIAGMTAAIYLKRENLDILIIEKEMPGGQLARSPMIENYPGYSKIEGPKLAMTIHKQVKELHVPIKFEEVNDITYQKNYKIIHTNKGKYYTKTVLLAMGRSPRTLGLEGENLLYGRGISYCATCDGAFYKDKVVAVVGGGNSAVIEAIFLSNLCKKVYLIHRRDFLRSEDTREEELKQKKNVEFIYDTSIQKLNIEGNKLSSITLSNEQNLKIDGLFVYIGFTPNTSFCKNMDIENNYIKVDEHMKTSVDDIYACGDILLKDVYQLTTAVGEATIAAESIKKRLLTKGEWV